ncbi:MAG: hypothetical protein ACR2J1_08115, partial [Methyloceanibacter sp.]|uniref:hypothetical protein n=1 Tax=Methyloceanibacter sp. TaxID=1965321 RepID=UPI003D9B0EEE
MPQCVEWKLVRGRVRPWNNFCRTQCGGWNNWCQEACGPWNGWCSVNVYGAAPFPPGYIPRPPVYGSRAYGGPRYYGKGDHGRWDNDWDKGKKGRNWNDGNRGDDRGR